MVLPCDNGPYRGGKGTLFEGGCRVVACANWPGHIKPGTTYHEPVSSMDILPTALAAVHGAMPTDRPMDGVDLMPYLAAGATAQAPRPLFWRDGPYRAVLDKGWKLIVSGRPDKVWLFDLTTDPTEKTNVAAQQPAKVTELRALLAAHHANMPAPLWPSFIEFPVMIDKTLDQKEQPGDEYTYWYN